MQSMAVLWFVCLFLPQLLFLIARACMDDSKIKKNRIGIKDACIKILK